MGSGLGFLMLTNPSEPDWELLGYYTPATSHAGPGELSVGNNHEQSHITLASCQPVLIARGGKTECSLS